jgi:hypothetical protein
LGSLKLWQQKIGMSWIQVKRYVLEIEMEGADKHFVF